MFLNYLLFSKNKLYDIVFHSTKDEIYKLLYQDHYVANPPLFFLFFWAYRWLHFLARSFRVQMYVINNFLFYIPWTWRGHGFQMIHLQVDNLAFCIATKVTLWNRVPADLKWHVALMRNETVTWSVQIARFKCC